MSVPGYHLVRYRLPAGLEDAFGAELGRRGVLGCEVHKRPGGEIQLDAYASDPLPDALATFDLEGWPGVEELGAETLEARDWLAEYRAAVQPFNVGRRWRVDPRDLELSEPDGGLDGDPNRILLRVPAQNAFGTGTHASTRVVLAWLDELGRDGGLDGKDVLDVGTGSGILAFAVLKLGARCAVGFDLDTPSVITARSNAAANPAANGVQPKLYAGRLAALGPRARFDLLLVNILPERILDELNLLLRHLRPGGRLLSSGNLWERREALEARFRAAGLELEGRRRDEEWVAFLWRR